MRGLLVLRNEMPTKEREGESVSANYWNKYYKGLEGATIVKFNGMSQDDFGGDGFPSFIVKFKDGTSGSIEISSDPEGNSGGFIFGLEMAK